MWANPSRDTDRFLRRVTEAQASVAEMSARETLRGRGFDESLLGMIPSVAKLPQPIPKIEPPVLTSINCQIPLDFHLAAQSTRPVALIHGPEAFVSQLASYAPGFGLHAMLSAWEMVPQADSQLGGYANLSSSRVLARKGSGAWRALIVGRESSRVVLAWLADLAGWDACLGACLGYPTCCVESFASQWQDVSRTHGGDQGILLLTSSTKQRTYSWHSNIFARYTGRVLVDHFPCKFDCPETLRQAEELANLLAIIDPLLLTDIKTRSCCKVVWSKCTGVTLRYGPMRNTLPAAADSLAVAPDKTCLPVKTCGESTDAARRGQESDDQADYVAHFVDNSLPDLS